ncbi:flagellin [Methanospirillum purgamenti]|uniref:Flagellin n=2 Tax=Methanospirillum hungatei TaxID=2203 RepID=A0A8F5VL91_METHU|nr:flagellin [Methanospirillum hungatei]QXO93547.1 flagellin [Methanospirillum hungatei]
MKKEAAFSGLEAAIVLIAFVVVAAVFSYVMLGAGFFATQKSQEVTYSGVKQSTSNLVLDGQLYGNYDSTDGDVDTIEFYLSIPEGGQPQDIGEVVFVYSLEGGIGEERTLGTGITIDPALTNDILVPTEKVKVTLTPTDTPVPGETFTIEIKPKIGASTLIAKTLATGYTGGVII